MTLGKILVVDDEKNLLELIEMGLEYAGYDVVTATNEADALIHVTQQAIDVAIVDLQLGESDGITLMEKIHMINPDMPVLILTGYGSIATAVDAMKRGAYGYHTKPFDSEVLLFEIGKIMENRRMSTEIKRLKGTSRIEVQFFEHYRTKQEDAGDPGNNITNCNNRFECPALGRKRHGKRPDREGDPRFE
jgi:DNA-binding NtrC family response regulator